VMKYLADKLGITPSHQVVHLYMHDASPSREAHMNWRALGIDHIYERNIIPNQLRVRTGRGSPLISSSIWRK
jgi:hypothetical protein